MREGKGEKRTKSIECPKAFEEVVGEEARNQDEYRYYGEQDDGNVRSPKTPVDPAQGRG